MHSLIAIAGALVAAVGSGVLLARCFRAPRGDLIAWSVGLLGLLVSLGSQAMGYASGFDATMFRAMEIGGQVVAPLAFVLALSEVAGKSGAARFCARLYIPALGIIALVVLALDQLATATFSKAWPPPFTFYQTPPNYVLEFLIGPVTALITAIAVVTAASRKSQPAWNSVLPGTLLGGAAALALAYPGLAQLVMRGAHIHVHLPLGSVFSILCALAAALAWLAGMQTGRVPLADLRGGAADPGQREGQGRDRVAAGSRRGPEGYRRDGPHGQDDGYRRGDDAFGRNAGHGPGDWYERGRDERDDIAGRGYGANGFADSLGEGGLYRGGGLYRPGRPGQEAPGSRRRADDRAGGGYEDFATGDFDSAGIAAGGHDAHEFAAGDLDPGEFATGDFDPGALRDGPPAAGWQSSQDGRDPRGGYEGARSGQADRAADRSDDPAEGHRAELFGQITIYTLIEHRLEEFDQLTERLVEQVRGSEPDTLVFIAHAVPSAPTQRILYEVYRSKTAYQRHLAQPHIRQFDVARRPYVLATNVVELGLQQAKVSPFPSVAELFPEPGYDTSGFERPDYLRDYGRTSPRGGGSREPL